MAGLLLIQDLAVVMIVAGGAAWLCQRLGLSVVVGYLVAGAVCGPHTPPFALVSDLDRVQTLAQVGLVFLVFAIGLNLNLSRLRRLGLSIVLATAMGALIVLLGCRAVGFAMGWTVTQALFLAGMLMVSSSAIISKVLDELNLTHERPGQMALGMTVLEDVVAVAMLTVLTSLIQFGGERPSQALLPTLGGLGGFVVLVALLSLLVVPKMLARLSDSGPPEIRTLLVTGLLLGLGWLAVRMGYSLALGAFVLGAIVGSTRYRADIEDIFSGVRHIFGAVFFVAVGMLVDFTLLREVWAVALGVTLLALVLRPIACALGLLAVGNGIRDAVPAAVALTPLGEFSFIIAQVGVDAGVLPAAIFPVAVAASLLTSMLAPTVTRRGEAMAERLDRRVPAFLRTLGATYRDWVGYLGRREGAGPVWKRTGRWLVQIGLSMLVIVGLILLANPALGWLEKARGEERLFPGDATLLFRVVFVLVLMGPLIALWRAVSALVLALAESAAPKGGPDRRFRPVLELVMRPLVLVVLLGWLLALLPSGQVFLGAGAAALLAVVLAGLVFRGRLGTLQRRIESELVLELKRATQSTASSSWSTGLGGATSDWDLEIDEVVLPRDSALAGRNLGQLALRKRFGCSVIGIDRQGHGIVNPDAESVLYPRDKLLLLGDTEGLAKAARVLGGASASADKPSGFDELTMDTLKVPENTPLAGRPLVELDLIREAGVQLGGIRRKGEKRLAPTGRDCFEPGDELLVLGTRPQIARFARMLTPDSVLPADSAAAG